jgi:site-specific recombinase XerD
METPFNHFFTDRIYPGTFDLLTRGPLAAHLMAYAQQLHDQGYAVSSGQSQLRMLGHFNGWLESKGLAAQQIDSSTLERYVRCRRKSGKLQKGDEAALGRLWRMLRPGEVGTPSSPPSACQRVLRQFQDYFRQERGLAEATITCYTPVVRAFLAECFPTAIPDFHQLCASTIAEFVQRHAERTTTKHATNAVSALRSFLRHLLHRGAIDTDLAACVPTIATWSLSNVPKFLAAEQIQRILNSCDRNTAIGKRNYAILLLLARLGLRAGEVVTLTWTIWTGEPA